MSNDIKLSRESLEQILSCPILGDKYIYNFSSMVQTKAGTHQKLFIGDTQYYITHDCKLSLTHVGPRIPMTLKERVLVSEERDKDQSKLKQHLKEIYGDRFLPARHGPNAEFTVSLIIAELFRVLKASGNQRKIPNLFTIVNRYTYPDALANLYIWHRRAYGFNIALPEQMSVDVRSKSLRIKMVTGNQTFVYSPSDNDCTVELNPAANGENVLMELMLLMTNLVVLDDLYLLGDAGGESVAEEEEDSEDFIESLHDVIGRQLNESERALRLKLEHMLTTLKIMEVYHGPTQIDNLSETVYRGTAGDETEIYFIGEDVSSKVLSKPAQIARKESMIISRPGSLDLNPSDILELIPSDNLMYPMLDGLIQEVKECLKDYRLNCNKLKDIRQYQPDEKDV